MEETRATILVTDDDLLVQVFMCQVLRQAGYHVLEARDGRGAIQLCCEYPGPIHLLITDVLMPGINGRELASRATGIRKSLPVLYVSGYVDDVILEGFCLDGTIRFIQKPFTATTLLRTVRETLTQGTAP